MLIPAPFADRLMRLAIVCSTVLLTTALWSESPLKPVKTDSPRDTMRSFIEAMDDYRLGRQLGNEAKLSRLNDAVRCLNLSGDNYLDTQKSGREAAIYLKEVIDRVIIINYDYVPEAEDSEGEPVLFWRLKDTEISIRKVESGERAGEYLFTTGTVNRAGEFYDKVKHLPYLDGSGQGALYHDPWLERSVPLWARQKFVTLYWWQWIGIFMAILIGLVLKTVVRYAVGLLRKLAARTRGEWDDKIINAVANPLGYVAAAGLWYLSVDILQFEGTAETVLHVLAQAFLSGALIVLVYRLINVLSQYLNQLAAKTESTLDDQLVPLLNRTLKLFVVITGVLVALQNLGVNVLSVLAGLGIGGLAFALAARDAVANFFGSLMILFDRPFQVGDWIIVEGNAEGTVEEVGFRSTRIRTFYNSVVSVPNSVVANATVDNMGQRTYRRIRTMLSLKYDTPAEKMEAFIEGVKNIIKANQYTRKDYYHVVFNQYAASSLDVMLYCFLKTPDWATELVERQNLFLEILRLAETLQVEFAYPTQTLHLETAPGQEPIKIDHDTDAERLKQIAVDFGPGGKSAKPDGMGIFTPPHKE
jgi:MscS family membrane protein